MLSRVKVSKFGSEFEYEVEKSAMVRVSKE